MRDAVIVAAVRTPSASAAAGCRPCTRPTCRPTCCARSRTGPDRPGEVDDVIWGCVGQVGDQSANIGRYAVLAAGWPESVPGTTINRACGSSQQAVDFAVARVMSGAQDVVVAGGVEVMSRVPLGAARSTGFPYGPRVMGATTTSPSTRA